jgi:Flp pilus assembly protein TadG
MDAGAAAVEFALVLPVLLALVFGVITWGLIFAAQISLNSSARDAARAGVVQPLPGMGTTLTCTGIANNARAGALTVGLNTNITITVTGPAGTCTSPIGGGVTGSAANSTMCTQPSAPPNPPVVQLNVVLTYTAKSPVPFALPSSIDLSANGVFQCEYT